ncbi:carbon-nitrogen family hydrolase [Alkalihalobacillus sp. LMS39]|uniref:carbon-nitrogen family hydrolase n=1 Tax=Alkalihalobacillus sp. LMS39 TaxID=2924032 RepID=UPI001FB54511|nr:carbon-nitrogen family hydrolase [Alkalihalobacillus sp. LMS39]UOE94336.1 carbon-nitrogen family hydrolase [Alkalihalobacillus sp. LMS39]
MKLALYQMDIVPGNPAANRNKVKNWVEEVMAAENLDMLVLPEMWTTAYTLPNLHTMAESEKNETAQWLASLAKAYNVNIIGGSIATMEDEKIYNRALVFNRVGDCIHQYDKMHLVPMLDEHLYLAGGKEKAAIFTVDGIKMGVIICYDLRFPELSRQLALAGAEIIVIVAEWPEARKDHWRILQRARAIENQCFIVSANRVGTYNDVQFCGRSTVVSPWGEEIAEGSMEKEETIIVTIDSTQVPAVRNQVPVFQSRRPNLYG